MIAPVPMAAIAPTAIFAGVGIALNTPPMKEEPLEVAVSSSFERPLFFPRAFVREPKPFVTLPMPDVIFPPIFRTGPEAAAIPAIDRIVPCVSSSRSANLFASSVTFLAPLVIHGANCF